MEQSCILQLIPQWGSTPDTPLTFSPIVIGAQTYVLTNSLRRLQEVWVGAG